MSKIHVTSPSGVQSQYQEEQLRAMWEQGLLQEGTQYWKEGMPEWKPLSDLFHVAPASASTVSPPPLQPTACSYAKDPRLLTSFLVGMLWISLGIEVVSMLSDFGQMALLDRPYTLAEADANDARQGLIGLAYLGIFIVTGIVFLKWIYRANVNCRAFGADGMRFTPGWAIGYYFIPFLNFVRPYQSMKEIWQVSHNPSSWNSQPGSALLGWWWALWLISGLLGQMIFRMSMNANTIDALKTVTGMSIFSSIIGIPLCLVALTLVKTIATKQEQLVTNGIRGHDT